MSVDAYPAHHNIFVVPEAVTTHGSIPRDFAARVYESYISPRSSTHYEYAKALVGNDELAAFYGGMKQAIDFHAQENRRPEPVAIVGRDQSVSIGHAISRGPGVSPTVLHVRQHRDYNFGLFLTHTTQGLRDNRYVRRDDKGATNLVDLTEHGISTPLEQAGWTTPDDAAKGDMLSVERRSIASVVAVGRAAVEMLPELQDANLANAYESFMHILSQPVDLQPVRIK